MRSSHPRFLILNAWICKLFQVVPNNPRSTTCGPKSIARRRCRADRAAGGVAAARSLAAEQILRDAGRGENVVARVLELPAQIWQIDVKQLALPLAHLARDDHRLDVGAIHRRYDGPGHLIERRHVDPRGVEDDDVSLLARRPRAGPAVQPQSLCRGL